MADVTSICNQALAAVGTRTSITSIGEQSNEARQCLLQYDPTRRHLLRSAHWGFARAYVAPALLLARYGTPENPGPGKPDYRWDAQQEPPPPWLYAYYVPSDSLAVRYIVPASATEISTTPPIFGTPSSTFWPENWMGPMVKFEISTVFAGDKIVQGQTVLLTNMPRAIICYTRDVENPNLFDESFTRAFVQGLAANICQALTGDIKLIDALIKMTNSLILDARVKSANEGLSAVDVMPDWFRVRGLGPSVGTGPWIAEYGPLFGGVS